LELPGLRPATTRRWAADYRERLKRRSVFARARFLPDAKQNGISEAVDALAHRKSS
jgi:hypothetical protein